MSFSQSLITDRPDQTESASIVGSNTLQWETGSAYSSDDEGRSTWSLNNSLFRIGVSKKLEFRVATELIAMEGLSKAFADLELGFKYQLVSRNFNLAYLGHVILPTGNPAISSDEFGYSQRINLDGQLSESVGIGVNLGYDYLGPNEAYFTGTYVVGFTLNEKIGVFTELFGEYDIDGEGLINFDLGFTYLLNDNLQFDISTGAGINEKSNFLSWGISWRIPPQN